MCIRVLAGSLQRGPPRPPVSLRFPPLSTLAVDKARDPPPYADPAGQPAGAVRGPGAHGVLVEALGEVQALEHELDAGRDRRPATRRRRGRRARRAGRRSSASVWYSAAGTSSPVCTTEPSSNDATIGPSSSGFTRARNTSSIARLDDAVEHLRVAAVVERLDLDLARRRRGERVEVGDARHDLALAVARARAAPRWRRASRSSRSTGAPTRRSAGSRAATGARAG